MRLHVIARALRVTIVPGLLAGVCLPGPAMAQDASPAGTAVHTQAEPTPAEAPAGLAGAAPGSDIIVTARRVEERLQDVPISITVFNQKQLDDRNVVTATDLATYTPSLSANSNFGSQNTTFAIRGFVQDIATAPSVGVYFADVVAPRGAAANLPVGNGANPGDFFDLQNVQVLKGPQGTLFGRNTTGGAVLLVPQRPTGRTGGYIEGSYGNYDMKRIQGVFNMPLSDTIRIRVGADHMNRDGYIRNTTGIGPDKFGDIVYTALRASIVADITPDLENYLVASYIHSEDNGALQKLVACDNSPTRRGVFNLIGLAFACPALAQNNAAGNGFYTAQNIIENPFTRTRQWRAINTTTWRASDQLTVKNIISYAEFRQVNNAMLFGTAFDTAGFTRLFGIPVASRLIPFSTATSLPNGVTSEQATFTDEFQVQGSGLSGRLEWQSGAYFEASNPLQQGGSQSPVLISCTDVATLQCEDPLAPFVPGVGGIGQVSVSPSRTRFRSIGLYTQANFKISDRLKLTGGIRYTWDRQRASGTLAGFLFETPNTPTRFCTIPQTTANNCNVGYRQSSDAPTWLIDLDYTPIEDVLMYAKYSRGYRTGGITLPAPPTVAIYRPEKVEAYEAGIKTSFKGAIRGTFNVAGFYNDFSDQQLQLNLTALPPNRGTATGIFNAGRSRIYGAEVDASVSPFRGLTLDASYAFIKTEIRSISLPVLDGSGGYSLDAQSVVPGDPLTLTPKHKVTATGTYELPLDPSLGRVSIGATFTYIGRQLGNYSDRLLTSQPTIAALSNLESRKILNLNLNWTGVGGSPIDLGVFATNVTNDKYYAFTPGLSRAVAFETAVLGEPRRYGARLRYRFGG